MLQLVGAVAAYADFAHDCAVCFDYFDLVCLSGYLVDSAADFAVPVCWLKLRPADWDVAENYSALAAGAGGSAAAVLGWAVADAADILPVPADETADFAAFAPGLAAAGAVDILPAAGPGGFAAFAPGLAAADAVDILPVAELGGFAAFVLDLAVEDAADTLPVAASDDWVAFAPGLAAAAAVVVRLASVEVSGSAAPVLDWNVEGAPGVHAAPAADASVFLYSAAVAAVGLQKQNLLLVIVILIVQHWVCSHYHFWTLLFPFYEQKYDLKQLCPCRQRCSYDFWLQCCCESIYQ